MEWGSRAFAEIMLVCEVKAAMHFAVFVTCHLVCCFIHS